MILVTINISVETHDAEEYLEAKTRLSNAGYRIFNESLSNFTFSAEYYKELDKEEL